MSQKKTEPFPASVKPVHIGVYQRQVSGLHKSWNYAYWNGEFWGVFVGRFQSPYDAYKLRDTPTRYHGLQWRGLAQKPRVK